MMNTKVRSKKMVAGPNYPGNYPEVNQQFYRGENPRQDYDVPPQIDERFSNQFDPVPTGMVEARSRADHPALYESPMFQQAVQIFMDRNGREPATDTDYEAAEGVMDIMNDLMASEANQEPQQDVGSQILKMILGN